MYELARALASRMNETYDALDRDRRDWWNDLAEKVDALWEEWGATEEPWFGL